MIRQRFSMFDGIGPKREQAIRDAGVSDWRGFLDAHEVSGLSEPRRRLLRGEVRTWSNALDQGDAAFFARNVPRAEHWMLFEAFGDSVRYLDIETTGLSSYYHDLTVVGIHDGSDFRALVQGRDLTEQALRDALDGCKLLVTYFGSSFDVPFLSVNFPNVRWDFPHFDLCFAGRRVGLTGGMKGVERTLGIARDRSVVEVDGFEAVRLWRAYERGSDAALKKLLTYNEADTRNLAQMAAAIYERLCRKGGA